MTRRIDPFAALDPCATLLLRETLGAADLDGAEGCARHAGLVRALRAALAQNTGQARDYGTERDRLLAEAPDLAPHVTLLERCAERLKDVLGGQALASDVLFPGGGMDLVEPVYCGNRWSDHFNSLTARAVASAVRARRAQDPGVTVRILEVGAGTGGTSAAVLAALDEHAAYVTFDYTDISAGFVQHGRRVHGTGRPWVSGRVLDLEQAPGAQGFEPGSYDLVLGTNVLHATSRIAVSLEHVHTLLRPGGLLLLNEITRAGAFAAMTFGLLDGWWAFQDPDLRLPDAPVLSPEGWRSALAASGFGAPAVFGWGDKPDASFQCLFVAERSAAAATVVTTDVGTDKHRPAEGGMDQERAAAVLSGARSHVPDPAPALVLAASVTAPPPVPVPDDTVLCVLLAERLAGLLGLDPSELAADRPLAEFGVDSIIAPQFVALLNRDLGATLVATDIFNHATLQGLARHMRGMPLALPGSAEAADAAPADASPAAMDQSGDAGTAAAGAPAASSSDIAVIGLSCRFPGTPDADAFWDLIRTGRSAITEVPPERWDGRAEGRTRWGGFLGDHDCFDPEFFNLSWREAEAMSPQQRVFLEQSWNALENAGYGKRGLAGMRCGVFVGAAPDGYGIDQNDSLSSLGGSLAILAARISYLLDLKGPSLPLDTACSSSLVAVHLACRSVLGGDCDMALAGGVSILMTDPRLHRFLDDAGMLSPTGQCHTFDARADGFVPGEGVGVVVLKRLDRALADGDEIVGVIRASGINQDGRTSGITAPSGPSQTDLETSVYTTGRIDPARIGLVEAHGTGTQLGDPIEVNALTAAFRTRTDRAGFCALGSVKTNIGHTLTAAGVAGLIKALLALRHRTIPPSLNFAQGNTLIPFEGSPFFVPRQAMPWPAGPRLAAVSSFGFSGTNAHVVVAEAPERTPSAQDDAGPALILLSGRTAEALEARRADLSRYLSDHTPRLRDLAFTLSAGRGHFEHRLAILVETLDDLRAWRGREWRSGALVLPARGAEDAALAAALADPARDFSRIAECYVRGGDADWTPLAASGASRIALPGYPFARQRFATRSRVAPAAPAAAAAHPMLGERTADGVSLRLDPAAPWLRDHRFREEAVFPAVAYVEAAREAVAAGGGVSLIDLRFEAPLAVRPGTRASIALTTDAGGAGYAFQGANGAMHARGRSVPATPGAAPVADVAALRARLPRAWAGEEVYARFRDLGFAYGPAFQVIRSLRADPEMVLAELAPVAPAHPALWLDPALLDGAVQAAIGLMLAGPESFGTVVPISIGRVDIHDKVTGPCLAHVALLPGGTDTRRLAVTVMDPSGQTLVTMQDLTVRVAPAGAVPSPDITLCTPVWEQASIAAAAPPSGLLLFDRDETLWRSLDGAPVLVRPGSAFCRLEDRSFAIDPGNPDDYARLLAALRDEAILPTTAWHLWSRKGPDEPLRAVPAEAAGRALRDGLGSIFHLTAAWARLSPADPVTILHVHADATGEAPLQAPVGAFAAASGRENPLLRLASAAVPPCDAAVLLQRLSAESAASWDGHERAARWDAAGTRWVRRLREAPLPAGAADGLPPRPVVLLTGALGGIGRHVARHLARTRQARLGLVGRSPASPASEALIAEIRACGGDALYIPADIADDSQASAAITAIRNQFGPVQAVVHAAGVTRDRFLLHKTHEDLASVLAPKFAGTLALDRATAREPLACFVCFSSVAGSFGNAGQTDYSAANRFQDAFVAQRTGPGRSLSIAWPYWRDGGMALDPAELDRRTAATGLHPIETGAALSVFDTLAGSAEGAVLVLPGERAAITRLMRGAATSPRMPATAQAPAEGGIEAAILHLRGVLARATAMPEERIHPDRPLEQYGIDSILVTRMNEELARDFPDVPRTLFFEHQTLRSAAGFLAARYPGRVSGAAVQAKEAAAGTGDASDVPAMRDSGSAPPELPPAFQSPVDADARRQSHGAAEPVAIIGIAGRYPGADSLDAFWDNLCADRDLITEIPPDRWNAGAFFDPSPGTPGRSYSRWGGFLSGVDQFDPLFFAIAPGEAASIDPNERLFLETCWEALENAGYTRSRLSRDPARAIGVYAGVMYGEYQLLAAARAAGQQAVAGSSPYWSVANRISYHMNLNGPSMAVDSACSSSLTAIHLACQAIASGECTAAIAGGVNLSLHPLKYVGLSQGRFAATDGRCHSFAAGGDGYVPGEGVGAVVLKPLSAAIADGDFIHAVIRGWAANHGGKTNGYTVPNPVQQAGVISTALQRAGVAAETVSYIEAHGTGTALGDPIEVAGLSAAFGDAVPRQSCALGSVKANIGHLEAAAGIAGLTRVVLQLRHRTLTPTHRHGPPNPNIDFAATPFRLQEVTEPWTGAAPLRAGISSFGAGGANAHLLVEEYRAPRTVADAHGPALFLLSARTNVQLHAYARRMADFLRTSPWCLADVCRTLQCGREPMATRLAFVARTLDEAADRLEHFIANDPGGVLHAELDDDCAAEPPPAGAGLQDLAAAWVRGAAIDWPALDLPGETVPLPAHPFMRRRYWLADSPLAATPTVASHPFLDRALPSLDGATWEKRFQRADAVIRDHVVRGRFLVPGVVQLEMARAAAASVGRGTAVLADIVWPAPLEVPEAGIAATIVVRRDGDALAFAITAGGIVTCQGRAVERGLEAGDGVDVDARRRGLPRHLAGQAIYDRLAAMGLAYGPGLRIVTDIWSDDRTLVAALSPTPTDPEAGLPPAVLDGALQSLLGFAGNGDTGLMVPFALGAVVPAGSLADARFVTATRWPGSQDVALFDLAIRDAGGGVLLRLDGLAARLATPRAVADRKPLTVREPAWEPAPIVLDVPLGAEALVVHGGDDLGITDRLRAALGAARVGSGAAADVSAIGAGVTDLVWVAAAAGQALVAQAAEAMVLDLLRAVRALDAAGRLATGLRLHIVTSGLQAVSPREKPDPVAGAVLGLAKCIALEYPRVAVTISDFDAASLTDPRLAAWILGEPATVPVRDVAWRDGVRYGQVMRPLALPDPLPPLRPGAVVLIVGGAGGIGCEIAGWMARDCSLRVALVGRRPEAEVADRIAAIPTGAGAVRYFQADATDTDALRAVVARLRAIWGGVDAAIHAALVLRDRTLARMDEATFRAVLAPKIAGSVALVEALSAETPRFVAFLSSVNVVSGSLGQANYVAGSSFVDFYARAVAAERPFRVVATDWGLWGDVGVVSGEAYRASLARQGVHPIGPNEGVAAFAAVLAGTADRVAIVRAEPEALRRLGLDRDDATAADAGAAGAMAGASPVADPAKTQGGRVPDDIPLADAEAAFAVLERHGRVVLRDTLAGMAGQAGKAWTTEGLRRRLGIVPRHATLFAALLHALAADDLIIAADGLWRLRDPDPGVTEAAAAALDAAERRAPWLAGPRRLLRACLDAYPALLRGEADPVAVLFPQASMALVEAAYTGNPIADRFNRALADAVRAHVRAAPAGLPLRVIELGAGTGSTTARVLEALAPFGERVAYLATDVSQRFLVHGAERFAGRPGVGFALYDVEKEVERNGQPVGGFDIVLAANVLHATADLGRTLTRVRRLLRPGGVLLLSEATRAQDFGTMVFGLTPGWWLAGDPARRIPHSPLATAETWQAVLREAGFADVHAVTAGSTDSAPHAMLVATNETAFATGAGAVPAQPEPVVAPVRRTGLGVATPLTDHLRAVLADVLKLDPGEVRLNESFDRYGLESLTALEIRNRLDRDIPGLPATLLFEHNTLARLAAWLQETHADAVARLVGPRQREMTQAGPTLRPADAPAAAPSLALRVTPDAIAVPAGDADRDAAPADRVSAPAIIPARAASADEPIAIIGHAGRYPGGPTPDAFWHLLRAGETAITEVPPDRWDTAASFDAAGAEGRSYTKWAGFIRDVDRFDPLFFAISPLEAEVMDPQERLFLETAWATLEQAGTTPRRLREQIAARDPDGSDVGVFAGVMNGPYQWVAAEAWSGGHANAASTGFWSIANRVSFLFDFSGPSMVVDTACSASLTAIHLACESLRRGECGAALAGGVNLILHPRQFINLSQARMVSRGAECRAFGAGADGFVDGEGVGAVLLKPLSAAERDGDRIEGVILASAVNAGGRTSGFTVPNPKAQARVIGAALKRAGVAPETITYVEAHGTGTALGDPIEIAGLAEALGREGGRCAIGAVKANIGHLEAAAGVAGLAKVLLQMRHRMIAPSRHAASPNPLIDFAATRFVLPADPMAWEPAEPGGRLRAGISSFGAGGANAHLVVESYPAAHAASPAIAGPHLVVLSARDADTLRAQATNLLAAIRQDRPPLADLAHTLRVGRDAMPHRLAVLAPDLDALEAALAGWLDGGDTARVLTGAPPFQASARLLAETEEGGAMLAGLLARADVARLAQLWVEGADIDWSALPGADARPIPLPTYPFRRERYWLPMPERPAEPAQAAEAPLLSAEPAPSDQAARMQLFQRHWKPAERRARIDPSPVLVLARDRRLARALETLWDAPIRLIQPSDRFAAADARTIRMDPASEADHAALIAHLAHRHPTGFAIVQALDWDGADLSPDGTGPLASILLTQAVQRAGLGGVRILHVFAQAEDRPLDQAVGSLARSAMQESDGCRLRAVGLAEAAGTQDMAAACRDELLTDDDAPEVLYRAGRRHAPGIEPVASDPDAATIGFRIGGAYLLVGGLGEVGCAIAERLGRDYRARIAIIGRSDPRGPALERLRALREAGIHVDYEACDLTDRPALNQALGRIRTRLGRLHGVLHLARAVEDALLVRKSAASVGRVMAAKVDGSIALDAALAGEELDWFVLCSSLAAWLGLAGGGDYALACAFQSGFARLRQQKVERGERSGRTVAICWPQWRHDRYLNDAKLRRLAAEGLQTIDARDGLRIIAQALQSGCTEVAAVKGSERALARVPLAYRQDTAPAVPVHRADDGLMDELAGLSDEELAAYVAHLQGAARDEAAGDKKAPPPERAVAGAPAPRQRGESERRTLPVVMLRREPAAASRRVRTDAGGAGAGLRDNAPADFPAPAPAGAGRAAADRADRVTPAEAILGTVCDFLKLPQDRFDATSEFAAFGMDSIKALHVAERLQKQLGVSVDPAMFYEFPTIAALTEALAERTSSRAARRP
ncbi:MAG: SDR family NAD(P)-dependent oxidoreductase [Acetobacteraceae bacterium]